MITFKQFSESMDAQDDEFNSNNDAINNALKSLMAVKMIVKTDAETYVAVMKALAALQGFHGKIAPFTATQPFN